MADRSNIGKTGKPFKMPIEWSKVREFARAIKDPNPLYFDPELAKKEAGGIPVPVTFLQTSAFWQDGDSSPGMGGFDIRRILHGEQEFELLKPILVGDTLTGVSKVADIIEKEGGRRGKIRSGQLMPSASAEADIGSLCLSCSNRNRDTGRASRRLLFEIDHKVVLVE